MFSKIWICIRWHFKNWLILVVHYGAILILLTLNKFVPKLSLLWLISGIIVVISLLYLSKLPFLSARFFRLTPSDKMLFFSKEDQLRIWRLWAMTEILNRIEKTGVDIKEYAEKLENDLTDINKDLKWMFLIHELSANLPKNLKTRLDKMIDKVETLKSQTH